MLRMFLGLLSKGLSLFGFLLRSLECTVFIFLGLKKEEEVQINLVDHTLLFLVGSELFTC